MCSLIQKDSKHSMPSLIQMYLRRESTFVEAVRPVDGGGWVPGIPGGGGVIPPQLTPDMWP